MLVNGTMVCIKLTYVIDTYNQVHSNMNSLYIVWPNTYKTVSPKHLKLFRRLLLVDTKKHLPFLRLVPEKTAARW